MGAGKAMGRRTLRQRKERFREKHGMKSLPHFAGKKPREKVIYRNPLAKPVPELAAKGQRKPFSMENVQWISIGKKMVSGGYGAIYLARMKFRGKNPQTVIIKKFSKPKYLEIEREKIRRLDQSTVPHPKMDCIRIGGRDYIIMEPYIKRASGRGRYSKFLKKKADLVESLDLRKEKDLGVFRQILEVALKLSKAGLVARRSWSIDNMPRADAFNAIRLKNGETKVFVQDLDTLQYIGLGTKSNFRATAETLLNAVKQKEIAARELELFRRKEDLM